MTSHYIDIRVIPCPETNESQLLNALHDRLHLALVQQRIEEIGASFPGHNINPRTLGNVLRLHSDETTLRNFFREDWLKGMRDHVRLSEILPVPQHAQHRTVQRRQFKTNVERMRRRRMQRKGETEQQAQQAIPQTVQRNPNLPYLQLHSRSTGQPFRLFIALGPLLEQGTQGPFNSHGLSCTNTIPWF